MDERRMVDQMLERPSWLRQRDLEFVKSVFQQLEARSRAKMSERQAEAIRNIYERWLKNQEPRFFQGGAPGRGRRR